MSKAKDMVKIDSRLLESILREREITKSELSRKIGKNDTYISKTLREGAMIPEVSESLICLVLGFDPGYFVLKDVEERSETEQTPADLAALQDDISWLKAQKEADSKKLVMLINGLHDAGTVLEKILQKVGANTLQLEKMKDDFRAVVKDLELTGYDKAVKYLKETLANGRVLETEIVGGGVMKVNQEEKTDRYGIYPHIRVSGKDANPQRIHEWLYNNGGYGYKFVMIFDCMADEWQELEKEYPIYHMDEIDDEIMEYIGVERVKQWLKRKGVIQ